MARKKKIALKRLSMNVPLVIHRELEKLSEKRNDTITKIVLQAITQRIAWEKKYD